MGPLPNPTGSPHFPNLHPPLQTPPFLSQPVVFSCSPAPVPNSCEQTYRSPAPSPGIWGALEFPRGGAGKRLPPPTLRIFFGSELGCFAIFRLFFLYFVPALHPPMVLECSSSPQGLWDPKMNPPNDLPLPLGVGANSFPPSSRGFHPKTALGELGSLFRGGPVIWEEDSWESGLRPQPSQLFFVYGGSPSHPCSLGVPGVSLPPHWHGGVSTIQMLPPNPWVGSRESHIPQFSE